MDFKNKAVIVTGASSGIGASIAVEFSAAGANVTIVGRNETKLAAVAKKCKNALVIRADISKENDLRNIIDETIKKFGQLDILINNAGTALGNGGLVDGEIMKHYDTIMNVNLKGVVHLTSLAAPHLIKTKGNVINISSIAGQMPPFGDGMTNYYVSKAGLDHFTVCAAVELARYGVRVNVVSPGPVTTDLLINSESSITWDDFPQKTLLSRVSKPEEIANLVLFLASDKAKAITGSNIVSDNGMLIKRG